MAAYRIGHLYRFINNEFWFGHTAPEKCAKGDVILILPRASGTPIDQHTFLYKEKVYTCTLPLQMEWVEILKDGKDE